MKNIVKSSLLAGALFGLAMGTYNGLRSGAGAGIASGILMGIVFGLAIAGFMFWNHSKAGAWRKEFEPEGLVRDAPANLGGAGGWLFLTKQRVVWIPHALNVGAKRLELSLGTITGAKPNGRKLDVHTTAGQKTFLVRESDEWAAAISPALPDARVVER